MKKGTEKNGTCRAALRALLWLCIGAAFFAGFVCLCADVADDAPHWTEMFLVSKAAGVVLTGASLVAGDRLLKREGRSW